MDALSERLKNMTPLQRAAFALKEMQAKLDVLERQRTEPIAIVGMACRFPGGANSPESYWRMLCDGIDAIEDVPAERWNIDDYYDPDPTAPGKMCTRRGGFLHDIHQFDNHFFAISDDEAARIDPQYRMLLELTWETLEDAGIPPAQLRGSKTGVFIGISTSEYGLMLTSDLTQTHPHVPSGTSLCMAANRVSFAYGLQGPSFVVDTACSSALVALHQACQSIRSGECIGALVGGANLLLNPIGTVNLTKAGFCAPDGRVRAFDAAASGYVRSEGAGLVMLMPLSAAQEAGVPVYAVIRGSAVTQNGASNGLSAPNRAAQEEVLREAYRHARISPADVQFVETQGTGTRLGDSIEAMALGNVLSKDRPAENQCALGAVKTNIGHLEAASGIASLMKTALALKHGQLPPNINFEHPTPDVDFSRLPLRVLTQLEPWPAGKLPRIAGVSAFGYGGSNSHVVLEEAPTVEATSSSGASSNVRLLSLSARTERALQDLARSYSSWLSDSSAVWGDICHTASRRRDHHDCRLSLLADSCSDAAAQLSKYLNGESTNRVAAGRKPVGQGLKIGFYFSDAEHGLQNIIAHLDAAADGFEAAIAEIDDACRRILRRSLSDIAEEESHDGNDASARVTTLISQLLLTAWWRYVGIVPGIVLGRGVGELAAAAAAGILTFEEVLSLVAARSGSNGAGPVVPSLNPQTAKLPFISSVDGKVHAGNDLDASHWQRCLDSAQAVPAAVATLADRGIDIVLEIGRASADNSVRQLLANSNKGSRVVPALRLAEHGALELLTAVGMLYAAGADPVWKRLTSTAGCYVSLPRYPWQRQHLQVAGLKQLGLPPSRAAEDASQSQSAVSPNTSADGTEVRRRPDLTTQHVAPRNKLEAELAEEWGDVLRMEGIGVYDNFFELGGHSLLAARMISRIGQSLGVELPLRELFHSPTVAELASRIDDMSGDENSREWKPIPLASRDSTLLPSLTQESLWFLDQLDPDQATYSVYPTLRMKGALDSEILQRAIDEIVRRHESMRSRYPAVDGRPVMVIDPLESRPLKLIDLCDLSAAEQEHAVLDYVRQQTQQPIDLQNGPLIRATLLKLADDEHVLTAAAHHMVYDGWSLGLLTRELATIYAAFRDGVPAPLPELTIQYPDFAAWQRDYLQGEELERLQQYWGKQLANLPPLDLPTDLPRPPIRSARGKTLDCQLSSELSARVNQFCRREGITPFMVLLAAFQAVLARYSGQDDIAVGSPMANRNRPEIEPMIGYFINMVVMRGDFSGDPSFRDIIGRVRQTALDAFEHQELTLDRVVDVVNPVRDTSRHPLFQVMFVLQNQEAPSLKEMGLEVEEIDHGLVEQSSYFELSLSLEETTDGFRGDWNFNTDLFHEATAERMIRHFSILLSEAIANPDRPLSAVRLADDDDEHLLLRAWNDTRFEYPRGRLIHQLFDSHAQKSPDATAVVGGSARWTYCELNRRANQLAHRLQREGVGPEVRVGICLERSPELLMAVMGVLKAGGAYVPLDPGVMQGAEERARFVLEDARVALLLTESALATSMDLGECPQLLLDGASGASLLVENDESPTSAVSADNLAYILYTSGSTGRPKGVMVTHGNLANAYVGWEKKYRLSRDARVHLQMASFGFDVFAGDMMRALCSGGTLVICPREILLDPQELLRLMRREQVDAAEFVPVVLRTLTRHLEATGETLENMRLVVVGSDAWYVADHQRALRVLSANSRLINSYGLTETTIDSCWFEGEVQATTSGLIPIGRPFPNVRMYVLDAALQPTPIGVPGELFIGGEGVARGYVDEQLDSDRYIDDPFAFNGAARMCRTGDRARWRSDGQLEFLGRADDQVKIRGFRIEPGEVDQVLREYPGLAEAAVAVRERDTGDPRLVAYVVPREGESPTFSELRHFLRQRLPEYMIPSLFETLKSLPVSGNGKVDRRALPEPDWTAVQREREYVAPRTPIECEIASIWSELLNIDEVGARDSFFELGGNSLLALRMASRVRETFAIEMPLVTLFTYPVLEELAEQVIALQSEGHLPDLPPIIPADRDRLIPASFGQEELWLIDKLQDGPSAYVHGATTRISGPLDEQALKQSVNEIVRRHEALRTTFRVVGREIVQVIAPYREQSYVKLIDLSDLPVDEQEQKAERYAQDERTRPFDLAAGPLLRVALIRLNPEEHVVQVAMHHLIYDGWSMDVLSREMLTAYLAFSAGQPSPLGELPIQYADFAIWQRNRLQGAVLERLRRFWFEQLKDLPALEFPVDHPRPDTPVTDGASCELQMDGSLSSEIRQLSSSEGATTFMTFMAAFQSLLQHYSGQDDFAVGVTVAGRSRPETEGLIGYFINDLPLRADLLGDPTFRELLGRVRTRVLQVFEHQEMPFIQLVRDLNPPRSPSRQPLVQAEMVFQNTPTASQELPGLEWSDSPGIEETAGADFELSLSVDQNDVGYEFSLSYRADLFEAETAQRILTDLRALLKAATSQPDQSLSQLTSQAIPVRRPQKSCEVTAAVPQPMPPPLESPQSEESPQSDLEQLIASIWAEALELDHISRHDNFFSLGGHSLLAVLVMSQACDVLKVDLHSSALFAAPTIAELALRFAEQGVSVLPAEAATIEETAASSSNGSRFNTSPAASPSVLVPLRGEGEATPLFCIHGLGGHIASFGPLANSLSAGRPVYALQGHGLVDRQEPQDSIASMAACYVSEVQRAQPHGPYLLAGWSLGGIIALEMAQRLLAAGEEVELVALLDSSPTIPVELNRGLDDQPAMRWIASQLGLPEGELGGLPLQQQWDWIAECADRVKGDDLSEVRRLAKACQAHLRASAEHELDCYPGRTVLFVAEKGTCDPAAEWRPICPRLDVKVVSGTHYTMLQSPHVVELSKCLDACLVHGAGRVNEVISR